MDGLHHAMTVVLGIERHMTGAFMAHGIVAHLIHDDFQQMVILSRSLLVVVSSIPPQKCVRSCKQKSAVMQSARKRKTY